jgi:hypothetical protein
MNRMDDIMAELLAEPAVLGVWLLGPKGDAISGAAKDPSIKAPISCLVAGETYFDLTDRQIYAKPIGQTNATLVLVLDHRASFGLITLRVRKAEEAIKQGLYRGADG